MRLALFRDSVCVPQRGPHSHLPDARRYGEAAGRGFRRLGQLRQRRTACGSGDLLESLRERPGTRTGV